MNGNGIKQCQHLYRKAVLENKYKWMYKNQDSIKISEKNSTLFITNDNMGGTRVFEDGYKKNHQNIIVLRRISYGERPDIMYKIENRTRPDILLLKKDLELLWKSKFTEIIINTLVHYSETYYFLDSIRQYKKDNPNCKLVYMVHDYNSICVNCNLFIKDHYCNLECKKEKCDLRLADTKINLNIWREKWSQLLGVADEIRNFSNSSASILKTVYDFIPKEKITVKPHDISYIEQEKIKLTNTMPFHLGIVGDCNADIKGRPIVKRLINDFGNDIRITLVGSSFIHYRIIRRKVEYTGGYKRDELKKVLEDKQITCVLFPSLCPETFSYLVSELIIMDIPVLCFNYGAQAEKIKAYDKGVLLNSNEELWKYIDQKK